MGVSFSGIPVQGIKDNSSTTIELSGTTQNGKLESCGAVVLSHLLAANTSVTSVDASSNSMGTAGAKAFGEMLQINTTLTQLNVSGNSFGKVQVGDSVKLKSSGEVKVVTQTNWIQDKISVE